MKPEIEAILALTNTMPVHPDEHIIDSATHIAQDRGGEWWWFELEPVQDTDMWVVPENTIEAQCDRIGKGDMPTDWKQMIFKL